jgi:hypothetical protein
MKETFHKVLDDSAPERLRGRVVKAFIEDGKVQFQCDMPDDPTKNELAYFKWIVGDVIEEAGLDLQKLGDPQILEG